MKVEIRKIILSFILFKLLITFIFCSNSKNETDKIVAQIDHKVIEINDRAKLKEFIKENKKFMLEVYLPQCHHCVMFAPVYEKLSNDVIKIIFNNTYTYIIIYFLLLILI